jgi:hypothetical protein
MGDVHVAVIAGPSGVEYQIEVEVIWDSPRQQTDLRVLGAIDDGRLLASLSPLTEDFLVAADDNRSCD